jgi:hypothetical protein
MHPLNASNRNRAANYCVFTEEFELYGSITLVSVTGPLAFGGFFVAPEVIDTSFPWEIS